MKRLIGVILTAALAVSLSACGNGESAPQNESANVEQSEAESQNAEQSETESQEEDAVHEDELTIEACEGEVHKYTDGDISKQLSFKVRNLSENTVDMASLTWQALDTNGDILNKGTVTVKDLAGGQAGWTGAANCTIEGELTGSSFSKIRIYRYTLLEREEGKENQFKELYTYDFNNEFVFDAGNITITE